MPGQRADILVILFTVKGNMLKYKTVYVWWNRSEEEFFELSFVIKIK